MLQLVADGIVVGSTIALGAVGLTLAYSILRFANFTHGEYLTWGAYFALTALTGLAAAIGPAAPIGPFSFGWPLLAALAVAAALTAALALLVDALLFARLRRTGQRHHAHHRELRRRARPAQPFAIRLWRRARILQPRDPGRDPPRAARDLGGLRITPDQLFVIGLTAFLVVALHLFLTRTTLGRAMRAVSLNPQLARIAGIDVERVVRATWIVGAVLAAVAGVFSGLTVQLRPQLGFDLLLPLFSAAILGGIGSVYGAVAGGLIVGLAESLSVPLVGAEYRAATAFVVLIAILLVRPTGLFGEET